jgi:hypothetical protein
VARLRADALERLEPLLRQLRGVDALRERAPGTFTWRGAPLLHFHSLASGLVADVKADGRWLRYDLAAAGARRRLVSDVRRIVAGDATKLAGRPT